MALLDHYECNPEVWKKVKNLTYKSQNSQYSKLRKPQTN